MIEYNGLEKLVCYEGNRRPVYKPSFPVMECHRHITQQRATFLGAWARIARVEMMKGTRYLFQIIFIYI